MKLMLFGSVAFLLVASAAAQRSSPGQGSPSLPSYVRQLGAVHFPGGEALFAEQADAVVVLRSGAVLVAGSTLGSLGELHAGPSDQPDVFLARFDAHGDLEWIRQLGAITAGTIPALHGDSAGPGGDASGYDLAADLAVGPDDSIYVTGFTTSNLGETHGELGDVFLAKFDAAGSLLWLRQIGVETASAMPSGALDPSRGDVGTSLAIAPSGAVFVAGYTDGDLGEANASGTGAPDAFLARFSADGRLEWLRQMGGASSARVGFDGQGWDLAADVALHPSGSIVLANTSEDFRTVLSSTVALLTFDAQGTPLASRSLPASLPGSSKVNAQGLAIERSSGRIFLAGSTWGELDEPNGGSDVYVASFDADLDLEWIRQIGPASAAGLGLDADKGEFVGGLCLSAGELILAGTTNGKLGEPNGGSGSFDVFLAKLSASDGQILSLSHIGKSTSAMHGLDASGNDWALGLAAGPRGSIGVVGATSGNLGEANAGATDLFVMRLTPDGEL